MNRNRAAFAAHRTLAAALAVAALCASCAAAAADAPLTLAEAQRRAVERSRQLAAQDAAVAASRDMAIAAAQLPDPVATVAVNNLPVDGPDAWSTTRDFMTMRSIGLMQEWTREEKRRARAERFDREADKGVAERQARVAAIQRDTALAWLDRYYVEAQAGVLAEQHRRARLEVDGAETAYRTGRGTLSDVLSARSALAMLDDRASELDRRTATTRAALARWIGDADGALADLPPIDALPFDPRALDTELEHHPQVAALARAEDVAAADVRVAQANKKADWSFQVMYSLRGSAYSNMISIGVSVPLQWDQAHRQDREVAAKLALLEQARAEREDMVRAHAAEVRVMIAEWESGRERGARYARELLPLAVERTEAVLGAYRSGKPGLADVLAARRAEIDVRLQALQLEADTARLWAQLGFLTPAGDASLGGSGAPARSAP